MIHERPTLWKLAGICLILIGAWVSAGGLWHVRDRAIGSEGWLYNYSYTGSLQWRMLWTGIASVMLGYIAYRKGTR